MHTLNRILVLLVLCVVLVPLGASAILSLESRHSAEESLGHAIDAASGRYRQRGALLFRSTTGAKELTERERTLRTLEQRKMQLRQDILKMRRIIVTIETRYGVQIETIERARALHSAHADRLQQILRRRFLGIDTRTAGIGTRVVDGLLGMDSEATARARALERFETGFVRDLSSAIRVLGRLTAAEAEREKVLTAYHSAEKNYVAAVEEVAVSEEALQINRAIMAEVHDQVLAIQAELARIDARLKAKAERVLIAKGLLTAEEAKMHAAAAKPQFTWPVYGRISAGFQSRSYLAYFGVPHHGADLVVPQSTPVAAASDGVVFLVRDGGKTGYTYVLIGHRGGYATLYGHLSATQVVAGQDVSAGEIIGLSGGQPGTYGAGPMTTAAHLHFEVIQHGVNVDPMSVLP